MQGLGPLSLIGKGANNSLCESKYPLSSTDLLSLEQFCAQHAQGLDPQPLIGDRTNDLLGLFPLLLLRQHYNQCSQGLGSVLLIGEGVDDTPGSDPLLLLRQDDGQLYKCL